jgi:hypothetical protein
MPFPHAFLGNKKKLVAIRQWGCTYRQLKKFDYHPTYPHHWTVTKEILVAIRQTHTIGWQPKFFDRPKRKMAPPLSVTIRQWGNLKW